MRGELMLAQVSQEELRTKILHAWEAAQHSWVIPIHIGPVDLSINKIIWFLFLGAAITFVILFIGARLLKDRPGAYQVIVEEVYGFGRSYLGGQIGDEGMKWFPYTLSIFVFLLTLNIIGLFPDSYPVTSNLSFTATLALITFVLTHYMGIKRNGAGTYFKSWVPAGLPVAIFMAPFMFFIHTLSEIARPVTLAVRLYANMLAGHLIIFVFLSFILYAGGFFSVAGAMVTVVAVPAAIVFYAFEIFVAVLQAYIFAILTQVYIELAIYADEGH